MWWHAADRIRSDTLEQIDVSKLLIAKYPDVRKAYTDYNCI